MKYYGDVRNGRKNIRAFLSLDGAIKTQYEWEKIFLISCVAGGEPNLSRKLLAAIQKALR